MPAASRPERDARLLAFAAGSGWNTDIYVIRADGTGLRRLTRSPLREDTPTWSPDGRQIAFSSVGRLSRRGDLYLLRLRNRRIRRGRLTHLAGDAGDPVWQPVSR